MNVNHGALGGSMASFSADASASVHQAMEVSMMTGEDLSDCPSTPDTPTYADDPELMAPNAVDDVVAQLAASGPVGVAAAEAINTNRRKRKTYMFETNPSIRKRQQTRLLRKLRSIIEEYTMRVGQQAVVVTATPGKSPHSSNQGFRVYGSQPLEDVMRSCRSTVMQELESTLAQRAPAMQQENTNLFELPPLVIDGMPTPIDKMTQAQLRNFIPEMLKYSTGRSKPGWGKQDCRPPWWPSDLPWANVRCDVRTPIEKKQVPWTHALRAIVRNCYKHHGRTDLLPTFEDIHSTLPAGVGTMTPAYASSATVLQTMTSRDGVISIIQIDGPMENAEISGARMVTLADGTQAAVLQTEANHAIQSIGDMSTGSRLVAPSVACTATPSMQISADDTMILETRNITTEGGQIMIPVSMYQTSNMAVMEEHQQHSNLVVHPQTQTVEDLCESKALLTTEDKSDVPAATQAVEVVTVSTT